MHGFYGCFLESAEKFPDATAAELQRASGAVESHSYAELRKMAESVGRWLSEHGVANGARCAIIASNGPLWVTSYLGIMATGATSVPLDTTFNSHQISKLLRDSGCAFIFTDSERLPAVEKAVEGLQVEIVLLDPDGIGAKYPALAAMIAVGPGAFKPANVADDDVTVMLYTSGTTADPKGVMLTHRNLLAEADAVFSTISVSPTDAVLAILPLFHSLAQMANLLLPFAAGARIVYLESMNTSELLRALGERGITLFCCVPQFFYLIHERVMQQVKSRSWAARMVFRILMGLSAAGRKLGLNLGKIFFRKVHNLLGPKMRFLITGGSAFDINIGRDLRTLGFNVLQAYGLTETSGGATCTPPRANVLGSVGQPLKGVEVKIVGEETVDGANHPAGEIVLRGGIVMKGYYNRPDATAETIRDGWLHTGDLGYLDERGNLFITGRKKEMIVLSSGKNIYPEELEAHYMRSPFIKEICVMGLKNRPGEPFSERLHAVIVPDFDMLRERKIVNAREVIRFDVEGLSMELPGAKRILSFDIWRDPLPRTTTRKLKRFEIQRRATAGEEQESSSLATAEPTASEALWLANPEVQKAIALIRQASKLQKPVLPASNLELDLGFDSMERVELLVALENELGARADEKLISEVYTVRELVDTLLQARGNAPVSTQAGWDAVLAGEPDDPKMISALRSHWFLTFFWFVVGKCVFLFVRVFFRLQVTGKENLPKQGPLILSPNHQSFLDGPIVPSMIPWRLFKDLFYVGTSEIFGKGIFGRLGRTFNLVPVDPDSNLVNAMRAGAYGLKRGKNLVLFPEGERSIDGTPKKFKKGAAILSTHLKVPIYPVALEGFYEAWPRHRKFPRFARLRVHFGEPIAPPASISNPEESYRELTDKLRSRVVEMWEGLRRFGISEKRLL
ncbi:MAG TPA: AMP-binding protein [Verrucomicrobiae bacterium]|nr:AMP-binding protein [Verrucomicrobiae bacterium]